VSGHKFSELLNGYRPDFCETLFNSLDNGVYFLDREKRIVFWNKGAELISGYAAPEVLGKYCSDKLLVHVDERGVVQCKEFCPVDRAVRSGTAFRETAYLLHKEGYRLPVSICAFPIVDASDAPAGCGQVFVDYSPRILMPQNLQELERMSLLDRGTEVANRQFIELHLHSRLTEMQRYKLPFGVLFIDVDHLSKINDRYGREVGDRVLRMIAKTLASNVRFFDAAGRWGKEEFLVAVLNISEPKLDMVANKLRLLISQSHVSVETEFISCTVSIGATLARREDSIESLVTRAEQLMLHSKWLGRNKVSITFKGAK
jgi:diguanylate cyclase (GGDEF)-like protein/PAS domain S-box-containing protein